MALYRFETSNLSRAKGQSAIARAAYNSRSNLKDHRTGEPKDYRYKEGVEFTGIFAPKGSPAWVQDRERLWNEVEKAEDKSTRRNEARTARDFKLALPWELNKQEREWLVKDFAREMSRKGMVVDVAIHEPEHDKSDERNYHVHMLCTTREIGPDGFGKKNRDWNRKEELEGWRERWAKLGAKHLEKAGHTQEAERFGQAHKTLERQREIALERGDFDFAAQLDREPTKHLGPDVTAMERRGLRTNRGDENRETIERNSTHHHERYLQGALPVWWAYERSTNPMDLPENLRKEGFILARVTKEDAQTSDTRAWARERLSGGYHPVMKEGEYVAVNEKTGLQFRLNSYNLRRDNEEIAGFLRPLDKTFVNSLRATENIVAYKRTQQLKEDLQESFIDKVPRIGGIVRSGERAAKMAFNGAAAKVSKVGKLIDIPGQLMEMFVKPLTPAQRQDGRIADAEKAARATEAQRQREWETEQALRKHDRDR